MTPEKLIFALIWSDSMRSLVAIAVGFAVAGMLSSGYQLMTMEAPSFRLMNNPERRRALAAILFLLFAAPFLIIRNTINVSRIAHGNFSFAAWAAFLAGFWSLMSGTLVTRTFEAIGRLIA